ncbi:hypothetical protein AB0L57_00710 [Nocardia sp. NPDC052254]|uniref:hypothetical protein n=1 Tax=Nocardia sp. NPDC052254 TaxID=3155681 RepID=UPI0034329804
MRKIVGVAAGMIATVGITGGAATAAPPADGGAVGVSAHATESQSVITIDRGTFGIDDNVFEVKAPDGRVLAGMPLSFRIDDFEFPITPAISGDTATLTPRIDREHATYKPVALPYEDQAPWKTEYDRETAAWTRLTSTITSGAALGTVIGGIGGSALGCVLGGLAGATVAAATIVGMFGPFIPAAAIGCLGGVIAVGALGTAAGQLLVTGPIAVAAVIQYFSTINAPAPQSRK